MFDILPNVDSDWNFDLDQSASHPSFQRLPPWVAPPIDTVNDEFASAIDGNNPWGHESLESNSLREPITLHAQAYHGNHLGFQISPVAEMYQSPRGPSVTYQASQHPLAVSDSLRSRKDASKTKFVSEILTSDTAPFKLKYHSQPGRYLERMFGEANAKQLLFKHPTDPGIISGTPATSPGRILVQSLPIPYKGTDREAQERSRNPLPSPSFFRCDDGLVGVPLSRAVQGFGLALDSNHDSPLGNRQTVRLKILPSGCSRAYDKQISTALAKGKGLINLQWLMKTIAKHTRAFLATCDTPADEFILIGYTFVSKGAIMPILLLRSHVLTTYSKI
ncbi:hypothetical protein HETIRDRAFT_430628 [Heterobasidion irregulare TC 32-1]|uniref:Uncharacterized protein n=1 Tax=Heterobasidion irregulare (strain TC 32-1) TaxID=747525 RepID=W4JNM4_HETIT|nr:uncharacterized protein HETIRDRAFT_430628 [Heterobasidion irregulare TC 32-1]ETW75143.1 hypothetical protein HETIRDRAFT_430628 [Heterobasidion irregulare TC 32-1]